MSYTPRNPDTIPVAANGDVYVARYSPSLQLPTDALTAPTLDFNALGYTSEEGVTFGVETETAEIPAWQSLQPVRKPVTGQEITANFELLEWNSETLVLAFGGGNFEDNGDGTWSFTLPKSDERIQFSIIIDALDGLYRYRIILPRVTVEDLDDINFRGDDNAGLGVTVTALPDIAGEPLYLYGAGPEATNPEPEEPEDPEEGDGEGDGDGSGA